jgi:hypothetical protein
MKIDPSVTPSKLPMKTEEEIRKAIEILRAGAKHCIGKGDRNKAAMSLASADTLSWVLGEGSSAIVAFLEYKEPFKQKN